MDQFVKDYRIRAYVTKMINDMGLKIAIRAGRWQIHKDPWYTVFNNPLITLENMEFKLFPEVTIHNSDYSPLAQQIEEYFDQNIEPKDVKE